MTSLRKSLKIMPQAILPQLPRISPPGLVIRKQAVLSGATIKKFYFHLPIVYIHTAVIAITLLSAIAMGVLMPQWAAGVEHLYIP